MKEEASNEYKQFKNKNHKNVLDVFKKIKKSRAKNP